jgi:hypothetical protein
MAARGGYDRLLPEGLAKQFKGPDYRFRSGLDSSILRMGKLMRRLSYCGIALMMVTAVTVAVIVGIVGRWIAPNWLLVCWLLMPAYMCLPMLSWMHLAWLYRKLWRTEKASKQSRSASRLN